MMKPRRYETLMLLSPDLSEEEHEQTKQKFIDIIEKMSGRIVKVDDWGRRRLAYPVKKQMYGVYVLLDYMGTPDLLTEYERNMRIDERVWKDLSLVLDKNFTEDKYQAEIDRINAEKARREAERAQREAERAKREADAKAAEEAAAAEAAAAAAAAAEAAAAEAVAEPVAEAEPPAEETPAETAAPVEAAVEETPADEAAGEAEEKTEA